MFVPELKLECDLLRCCCYDGNGEIEVTSEDLRKSMSDILDIEVRHIFFAPDVDCAPVGIVVEYRPFDDSDPWMCYPVILTREEVEHFHIEPWQEYQYSR